MWDEDEDYPDPDYGVFGDIDNPTQPRLPSKRELEQAARERKRRDAQMKVSSDFNRYMIDLFNQSQKR